MQEELKEIYEEFELLATQFSSSFNDAEFVDFKKAFDVKNTLNYRDFDEFDLEKRDKNKLKDIQICLLACMKFYSDKTKEEKIMQIISKITMPIFLVSRLYFALKEEKINTQICKMFKEKDKLMKEKHLWISQILPF